MGGRIAPLRTVTLHDLEELNNDLGARSDQDLTLAGLLGIVDGVKSIVENGSADHFGGVVGMEILKSNLEMRYLPVGENMLASRGREQEECPPEMDQRGFCRSFPKKRSVSRASDDQDSTLFLHGIANKRKTLFRVHLHPSRSSRLLSSTTTNRHLPRWVRTAVSFFLSQVSNIPQ